MREVDAAIRALAEAFAHLEAGRRAPAELATERCALALEAAAESRDNLRLCFEDGTALLDDVPFVGEAELGPLASALERAGLRGLELPAPTPGRLLPIWLASIAEGTPAFAAPVFDDVGLRGLPLDGRDGDLDDLAAQLGASPTPERGTPVPGFLAEQPPPKEPEPTPPPEAGAKGVLRKLVEAADAFEHLLAAVRADRVGVPHLVAIERAADELAMLGAEQPVLCLRVHRIRARGSGVLSPDALHAAGTALITAAVASCLEVPTGSAQRLTRGALFAHLPAAFGARPPSPAPLADGEARRLVEAVRPRIPSRDAHWLDLAWLLAQEHRLGLTYENGAPTHSSARLVGVVAGFDALSGRDVGGLGLSHGRALQTLARNAADTFDPHYVTVLTTLVACAR